MVLMNRRNLLALLGAAPLLPSALQAQAAPLVVGFLGSGIADDQRPLYRATLKGLKEAGFVDGQNLRVEQRWAEGNYEKLPALAAELVSRKVALIVAAGGSDPARAAKAATTTIPIVFISAADPVRTGLVATLNRPEANVTGVAMVGSSLEGKRLALLHDMLPLVRRMGVLINPAYPAARTQHQEITEAGQRLGLEIVERTATTLAEIDAALAAFVADGAGAVLVANDPFFGSERTRIAERSLRNRLPAMSFRREFAEVGGLISYGADFAEGYRQTGIYAGKILAGAKPADLPVVQPTKFELVVNLRTAKQIGLTVSEGFLLQADEVLD